MTSQNWKIVFAAESVEDLLLIEHHLVDAYLSCGESPIEAQRHAETRIEAILSQADRISAAPYRGAARDDVLPNLRHLTIDRTIYWFMIDEDHRQIRVLAIFFGGQDHQRKMLVRLLGSR